jgi:hypothetical protein
MQFNPSRRCRRRRSIGRLAGGITIRGNFWLNSACDWGVSDPLAVPKTALEMKRRGHLENAVEKVIFQNPKKFLSQSRNFKIV